MKFQVYKVIIFLLLPVHGVLAQYTISGSVVTSRQHTPIADCSVYLDNGSRSTMTNSNGQFTFEKVPSGIHTLHFTSLDYNNHIVDVKVEQKNIFIEVLLEERENTLKEIVIKDSSENWGLQRLRAIEEMGIYEGKKTEVIIPSQLVANLSTNNARQIYARVPGLNIWESDGAGLQLGIGGRGLDPNRTSNFNVRQNGYDISADALGYPESYYTPPSEAIGKIQIVRGAASLQYGTQFGGMINFSLKKPIADKKFELISRLTGGSFGFLNSYNSISGKVNKISYYSFFQYKQGDGWRKNSDFEYYTSYGHINYALSEKTTIDIDVTHMNYLAHQPGGLTDEMFQQDARQSNRERNWFKVKWNLFALHFNHKLNKSRELNIRLFGLDASRYSVGFRPNRVATVDDGSERDLIKGDFQNYGAEIRYLSRFTVDQKNSALLLGARYYHGLNLSKQGLGSKESGPAFNFVQGDDYITYDYRFPNRNAAFFGEYIFDINPKISLTPGFRIEYIKTTAGGYYGSISRDLAGNIIDKTTITEIRKSERQFILAGLGISFKPTSTVEVYSNLSQNYRSITFSDMRISSPSSDIDPKLKDERGYSLDLGVRSSSQRIFNYDISLFYLNYNNRIGEIQFYDENNRVKRLRTNVGQAIIRGLETYGEFDFTKILSINTWNGLLFSNIALIKSQYKASQLAGIENNQVEFVPTLNVKTGSKITYKNFQTSFQLTYLTRQFTDATNAVDGGVSAVVGLIPSYAVMDLSFTYKLKKVQLEASVNNLTNNEYFTRRATGYPGPGILPSDGRSFFMGIQVQI